MYDTLSSNLSQGKSKYSHEKNLEIQFFNILSSGNKFQLSTFLKNNRDCKFWYFTCEDAENNNGLHVCVQNDLLGQIKLMFEIIEERENKTENESINQPLLDDEGLTAKQIISNWINSPNSKGDTCLHYVAYKGNYKMISLFSNYNIFPQLKNKQGNTVMHKAAQGNQPLPFIFYNQKYNVSAIEGNKDGSTPLHWACFIGSEVSFNFIINYYDDINIQDNDGFTPLHLAVVSEKTEIVKKLLQKGANKEIRDLKGRTPKLLAEEKGKDIIADMLKEKMICSLFVWKNPLKKIERNYLNVYFFVGMHAICEFAYFSVVLPCKFYLILINYIF